MRAEGVTHPGLVRTGNEDEFLVGTRGLLAVADGMGGHNAGGVASRLAITYLDNLDKGMIELSVNKLVEAFAGINRSIYERSLNKREEYGMGTTLTAVLLGENQLLVAHVGDSRAYLFRHGQLIPLTRDHSFVGELVEQGGLSPEDARNHPHRHVLTRALGTNPGVEVDTRILDVVSGDQLLLCTDGLVAESSDAEIGTLLINSPSLRQAVDQLIELALSKGGQDNITVVLAEI